MGKITPFFYIISGLWLLNFHTVWAAPPSAEALYEQHCGQCHSADRLGHTGPALLPESLKRLVDDTGRRTVPCLYIDNKPMFESADIMDWLSENSDKLEKNS